MDTRIALLSVVVLQCGHKCVCEGVRRGFPAEPLARMRVWRPRLEPRTGGPLRTHSHLTAVVVGRGRRNRVNYGGYSGRNRL
jgi:hypothetical protein